MAFKDCACWVFGFVGYTDDDAASKIGKAFEKCGTLQPGSPDQAMQNFYAALVDGKLRGTDKTVDGQTVPIVIYGSFQKKSDPTPSHVWIECKDHILETWVGMATLHCEPANDKNRYAPTASNITRENRTFVFGKVEGKLTTDQYANITQFVSSNYLRPMGFQVRRSSVKENI
jgi:hypothetical protein